MRQQYFCIKLVNKIPYTKIAIVNDEWFCIENHFNLSVPFDSTLSGAIQFTQCLMSCSVIFCTAMKIMAF